MMPLLSGPCVYVRIPVCAAFTPNGECRSRHARHQRREGLRSVPTEQRRDAMHVEVVDQQLGGQRESGQSREAHARVHAEQLVRFHVERSRGVRVVVMTEDVDEGEKIDHPVGERSGGCALAPEVIEERRPELHRRPRQNAHLVPEQPRMRADDARARGPRGRRAPGLARAREGSPGSTNGWSARERSWSSAGASAARNSPSSSVAAHASCSRPTDSATFDARTRTPPSSRSARVDSPSRALRRARLEPLAGEEREPVAHLHALRKLERCGLAARRRRPETTRKRERIDRRLEARREGSCEAATHRVGAHCAEASTVHRREDEGLAGRRAVAGTNRPTSRSVMAVASQRAACRRRVGRSPPRHARSGQIRVREYGRWASRTLSRTPSSARRSTSR